MNSCFLGIGSNLGNRQENIFLATSLIEKSLITTSIISSSLIETQALLKENSPPEWNIPFINCVLHIKTHLHLHEIFHRIKEIEEQIGRNLQSQQWSPRIIDIDILTFNNIIYDSKNLQIPHPQLHKRIFVLQPLCELAPNAIHPVFKQTFQELYHNLCNEFS